LDPDLQITLNLAIVDGLVVPGGDGRRVRLTEQGIELANLLHSQSDLLKVEKDFLAELQPLSDAVIERRIGEAR
jgi:hypothetical protein